MFIFQIRRDPRINWIVNPVHKRREARGLTSIGKQVGVVKLTCDGFLNDSRRTVAWAKAIVTITHLLALPGRNTTHSACVAIVDFSVFFSTTMCLFFMLRTAINVTKL